MTGKKNLLLENRYLGDSKFWGGGSRVNLEKKKIKGPIPQGKISKAILNEKQGLSGKKIRKVFRLFLNLDHQGSASEFIDPTLVGKGCCVSVAPKNLMGFENFYWTSQVCTYFAQLSHLRWSSFDNQT